MAPSGLAAARNLSTIPHGARGGVELRSSLAGRPLVKARPRAKSQSSRPASRLVVRAARQVSAQELNNGFVLYTYNLNEDSDSEDQAAADGSHARGSRRDAASHAAGTSKATVQDAGKDTSTAAGDHGAAPQKRAPPKFIKLSPVPAARLRGQQKEAEAAELRQAAAAEEAAKAPVVVSKKPPEVTRPPSSFKKNSPVVGSLSRVSGLASSRVSPVQGVRLRSRFVKRSPLADFRQRRYEREQELQREASSLAADSSLAPSPSLPPRPQSRFRKRSPVADWAARPRTPAPAAVPKAAVQQAEKEEQKQETAPVPATVAVPTGPSKPSVARPPSRFQKRSPVVMARAVFGVTGRVRGVPAGANSSSAGAGGPPRLPSSFQKRSAVLDAQGRPVVIRTVSLEPRTASSEGAKEQATPDLVGSPAGAPSSESSSPAAPAGSGASGSPERQPSSFKRVRRPLPATEPQVPASRIPIQEEPNGTPIHNRLPIAQPLGAQSPALMEDWGTAESAADGLVTAQATVTVEGETVTVQESVTVEGTVTVQEAAAAPEAPPVEEEVQPLSEKAEEGSASGEKYTATELSVMTVASLKELAKGAGLKGYSKLKKKELIALLLQES